MTLDHIKKLAAYNMERGDLTKQAVLNVIKWIGEPVSPGEITDILYSITRSELSHEYECGRISKKEVDKKTKEQAITIRTVHRKLSLLVDEGLLYGAHGKYELTPKAKSDLRYFAREFGNDILAELMWSYVPAEYSLEKNADLMVRLFGVYVLFCFLEIARPVGHGTEKSLIYGPSKDEVISSCLQHLIRTEDMFGYFLSTLDYLTSDDDAKKSKYNKDKLYSQSRYQKLSECFPRTAPPCAIEINIMNEADVAEKAKPLRLALEMNRKGLNRGPLTLAELNSYGLAGLESRREASEDKLQAFGMALSKAYPDIYPRLAKMTSTLKENPKQKLKELREAWKPLSPKKRP